jgi:3-deoxy-D-manno-octulosonate 8-phosphate phosphatase (KDO 8-P phosphatase)
VSRPVGVETPSGGGGIDRDLAKAIRLVIFDVDGVLTDAGVYMGRIASGEDVELKRFDIQDGLGLKMLRWAGLDVAVVSGRVSEATSLRALELGIDECHQDAGANKLPVVREILERKGLTWDQIAMLADDLPDIPVFSRVGLPAAVANAQPEILERAVWQSQAEGGRGAAREFCRALLLARGEWEQVMASYLGDRGGVP